MAPPIVFKPDAPAGASTSTPSSSAFPLSKVVSSKPRISTPPISSTDPYSSSVISASAKIADRKAHHAKKQATLHNSFSKQVTRSTSPLAVPTTSDSGARGTRAKGKSREIEGDSPSVGKGASGHPATASRALDGSVVNLTTKATAMTPGRFEVPASFSGSTKQPIFSTPPGGRGGGQTSRPTSVSSGQWRRPPEHLMTTIDVANDDMDEVEAKLEYTDSDSGSFDPERIRQRSALKRRKLKRDVASALRSGTATPATVSRALSPPPSAQPGTRLRRSLSAHLPIHEPSPTPEPEAFAAASKEEELEEMFAPSPSFPPNNDNLSSDDTSQAYENAPRSMVSPTESLRPFVEGYIPGPPRPKSTYQKAVERHNRERDEATKLKDLRRPQNPWETNEAYARRQAELAEYEEALARAKRAEQFPPVRTHKRKATIELETPEGSEEAPEEAQQQHPSHSSASSRSIVEVSPGSSPDDSHLLPSPHPQPRKVSATGSSQQKPSQAPPSQREPPHSVDPYSFYDAPRSYGNPTESQQEQQSFVYPQTQQSVVDQFYSINPYHPAPFQNLPPALSDVLPLNPPIGTPPESHTGWDGEETFPVNETPIAPFGDTLDWEAYESARRQQQQQHLQPASRSHPARLAAGSDRPPASSQGSSSQTLPPVMSSNPGSSSQPGTHQTADEDTSQPHSRARQPRILVEATPSPTSAGSGRTFRQTIRILGSSSEAQTEDRLKAGVNDDADEPRPYPGRVLVQETQGSPMKSLRCTTDGSAYEGSFMPETLCGGAESQMRLSQTVRKISPSHCPFSFAVFL
jgi:hypothetical protein